MSEEEKKTEKRAFCFCVGELVDCIPGVVLDCNNKRLRKCPKQEELKKEETVVPKKQETASDKKEKKDNRSFCFCLGAQVDCLPGVVLDCNNKRTTQCPLVAEVLSVNKDKDERVQEFRRHYKEGRKAREAVTAKEQQAAPDKQEKKDNRSFCFCLGAQVDCLPGVVLDCNNKRTTQCPLVAEVLSVNKDKDEKVREFRKHYQEERRKNRHMDEADDIK